MAEQSKQVKGIKVDKVLVVPSAEARGFRSREALLQASKHGDALLKRGRRLQQARYPRRRTPMLDDPELRRLNVSAEQYAAVERRVIDRLAREAGGEPRTGRGGHARTGPRSSGKDATVSDELPDAQQEAVWPDQSAVHGVLLEQVKDAYAEGIADTVAKLRVRAAEMLPEVASFTMDEIEAIVVARRGASGDDS